MSVCFGDCVAGKALSKKHLASGLCECSSEAYRLVGRDPPSVVRTHSTRGVSVSTALFSEVCVEDICPAVAWMTSCLFIQFYLSDMPGSFSGSVLTRATADWCTVFPVAGTLCTVSKVRAYTCCPGFDSAAHHKYFFSIWDSIEHRNRFSLHC